MCSVPDSFVLVDANKNSFTFLLHKENTISYSSLGLFTKQNWYLKCVTEILVTVLGIFFPPKTWEFCNRRDSTAYYFLRKRTSLWDKSCKNYVVFSLGNA